LESCTVYHNQEAFIADQSLHLNDPAWFEPGLIGLRFTELRVVSFREVPGYMRIFEIDLDLEIPPPPAPVVSLPVPRFCGTEEEHARIAAVLERFPGNP